jgi:hypothetical protein
MLSEYVGGHLVRSLPAAAERRRRGLALATRSSDVVWSGLADVVWHIVTYIGSRPQSGDSGAGARREGVAQR